MSSSSVSFHIDAPDKFRRLPDPHPTVPAAAKPGITQTDYADRICAPAAGARLNIVQHSELLRSFGTLTS
jgi:hypothetical protein